LQTKWVIRVLIILGVFAGMIWISDKVTLEGERSVYSVECVDGSWSDLHCSGKLAAGPQYRFRASKSRQEVLFWIYGSAEPSGKYTDCQVKDRGNWTCNMRLDLPRSITYEMADDRPTRGGGGMTLPFHAVPKWKWWALHFGLSIFSDASY
jgi:hypothetical protein